MISELTSKDELDKLINDNSLVLLDFMGSWCSPCKMMNPVLDLLDGEYKGKLKIMKIDVDLFSDIVNEYKIKTVPTFLLYKDKEIVYKHSGAAPKSYFVNKIDPFI